MGSRGLKRSVGGGCWRAALVALLVAAGLGCGARTRQAPGADSAAALKCEDCGKVNAAKRARAPGQSEDAELGLCLACAQKRAELRSVTVFLCPECGREVGREESVKTLRRGDVTQAEWEARTHIALAQAASPCGVCRRAAGRTAAHERAQAEREMRSYQGSPAAVAVSEVKRQAICGGEPAGHRREFVLIHLRVENRGPSTIHVSPKHVRVITEGRRDFGPHAATAQLGDRFRESDLEPGEKTDGWLAFHTLPADPLWVLVYHNARLGTVKLGPVYKPLVMP